MKQEIIYFIPLIVLFVITITLQHKLLKAQKKHYKIKLDLYNKLDYILSIMRYNSNIYKLTELIKEQKFEEVIKLNKEQKQLKE